MSIDFKLSSDELKQFHDKLKHNKEFGGVLNIHNGIVRNKTTEKGGNYSISYNQKNDNYEFSYHTHAYYPSMRNSPQKSIMKSIKENMKNDLNKALYLFECDIMKIHPPSPQDCYVCSLKRKKGMLVFTQEGIYTLQYEGQEPISVKQKDKIDKMYYKCMWGSNQERISALLSSGNQDKIYQALKSCYEYRKNYFEKKCIRKYLNYLKSHQFKCKRISWKDAPKTVFFS